MTAKELYDWAKKEGKENLPLTYEGDEDIIPVIDLETTTDEILSITADPRKMIEDGDYYGVIFDGKGIHYIKGNREVSKEFYFRYGDKW